MAKKKKKKTTWGQRIGRRMDRRQKSRQALRLKKAGLDPTEVFTGKRAPRRGGADYTPGPVSAPDWTEYLIPGAALGLGAVLLSRSSK
ncbi:MAG: hypothetical protein RI826_10000 [Chlorobium phaeovibrioides]|nr:hypothetical protein [Chlorobium phaeovibrioides]